MSVKSLYNYGSFSLTLNRYINGQLRKFSVSRLRQQRLRNIQRRRSFKQVLEQETPVTRPVAPLSASPSKQSSYGATSENTNKSKNTVRSIHEWKLGLDIKQVEPKEEEISLPWFIYLYSPWKYVTTKLNMLKLKFLWDIHFDDKLFIHNSKRAAILITSIIRAHKTRQISICTTPMGYKQISHDMLGTIKDKRLSLLRFRPDDIKRAIPLKVKMLRHYGHKFAFIDMLFVAMRRTNDFESPKEIKEIEDIIKSMNYRSSNAANAGSSKRNFSSSGASAPSPPEHPIVFAEMFIRFRRDYSLNSGQAEDATIASNRNAVGEPGQWLISNYKILQFDLMNYPPSKDLKDVVF